MMTKTALTLLIVDDSPIDLQVCKQALKDEFKLIAATNGSTAIAMEAETAPDLILLDVSMPEINGYETCQKIITQNPGALVIFISANTSTEEILQGYAVGGVDYVTKPFSPEVLIKKIHTVIEARNEKEALNEEVKMASQTAMSIMAASGDLGAILDFIRKSFTLVDYDALGVLVMNLLRNYDLSGCVMLKLNEKAYYFCNEGEASPIEKELLYRFSKADDRFYENAQRLFIHYGRVSILIKDLPIENADLAGRLKDSFAIATEAANERAAIIETQEALASERHETLEYLDSTAQHALASVKTLQKQIERENEQILEDLQSEMEEAFIGLGLSEDQESFILELLLHANTKSSKLFEKSQTLEAEMDKVFSIISKL